MKLDTGSNSRASFARPLPPFDANGVLPVGIHDCNLDNLARATCFNPHRRALWLQFMAFLAWPILNRKFSHAHIGGGFVSTRADPEDIDVVLETATPYGPEAFTSMSRFFAAGLDQIRFIYGVHLQFWMKGAPEGLTDYRTFFQYDRSDAISNTLDRTRGVVRLSLIGPGAFAEAREHLRGRILLPSSTVAPAISPQQIACPRMKELKSNEPGSR